MSAENAQAGSSLWRDAWLRMGRNKAAMASLAVFTLMVFLCFVLERFCARNDPYVRQKVE